MGRSSEFKESVFVTFEARMVTEDSQNDPKELGIREDYSWVARGPSKNGRVDTSVSSVWELGRLLLIGKM